MLRHQRIALAMAGYEQPAEGLLIGVYRDGRPIATAPYSERLWSALTAPSPMILVSSPRGIPCA